MVNSKSNLEPSPTDRELRVEEAEREKAQITQKLKSVFKSLAWQHHKQTMNEADFNRAWQKHKIHSMDYYETVWYLMEKGFRIQELLTMECETEQLHISEQLK